MDELKPAYYRVPKPGNPNHTKSFFSCNDTVSDSEENRNAEPLYTAQQVATLKYELDVYISTTAAITDYVATLRAEMAKLDDCNAVHANILAGKLKLTREQALHIAGATDYDSLREEIEAKQARIDSLMLEFCPDEMTEEQIFEWGKHQKPYDLITHSETSPKPPHKS